MSNMKIWHRAKMRDSLGELRVGDDVVLSETAVPHTSKTLGRTFWVMSVGYEVVVHVAEPNFGEGLYQLVTRPVQVSESKQAACTERCTRLLAESAYAKKNRKKMTYMFGPRPAPRSDFSVEHNALFQ